MSTLLEPDIAAGCVRYEARSGGCRFDSIRVDDARIEVVEMISENTVGKAIIVVEIRLSAREQGQKLRCSRWRRVGNGWEVFAGQKEKSDAWRIRLGGAAIIWLRVECHGWAPWRLGGQTRSLGTRRQHSVDSLLATARGRTALGEAPWRLLASAGVGEGCRDAAGVPARMGQGRVSLLALSI